MKPKFIQCEFCKSEIPSEVCTFAALTTTIDGKEYTSAAPNVLRDTRKAKQKPDERILFV